MAWNDRDRWLAARVLVIVLGLGLMFAHLALPSPKDGCEYDPACVVDDIYGITWIAGVSITLTAVAVWVAGTHARTLAILEGFTLMALGYFFAFAVTVGETGLSAKPGWGLFFVGAALFVIGTLSVLYKGFTRLRGDNA